MKILFNSPHQLCPPQTKWIFVEGDSSQECCAEEGGHPCKQGKSPEGCVCVDQVRNQAQNTIGGWENDFGAGPPRLSEVRKQ